jgi:tRNA (mo5U34)-methyltransferase
MTLAPGVQTPGWFDLRSVVNRLPWPDVAGKRCLDIGTWDGFLAFELERRGAAEVVATDIEHHEDWDHLPRRREAAIAFYNETAGTKGAGFTIAAEALGSRVQREWINIYDLSPERVGTFDIVVCGALLLHLRSPFAALEAIRGVCKDQFLSAEQITLALTLRARRRPVLYIEGDAGRWTIPNAAGHRRMVEIAGFDILRSSGTYLVPFGPGHPPVRASIRHSLRPLAVRSRTDGVPYQALLGRRAV